MRKTRERRRNRRGNGWKRARRIGTRKEGGEGDGRGGNEVEEKGGGEEEKGEEREKGWSKRRRRTRARRRRTRRRSSRKRRRGRMERSGEKEGGGQGFEEEKDMEEKCLIKLWIF